MPLLAGACAEPDDACQGTVVGSISYYGSSVPPPYHVEWIIVVDGNRGRFEVTPGYGAPQRWSADFAADQTLVTAACTTLAKADQVDEPPPGSAVITAELTGAEGRTLSRRTTAVAAGEIYLAVRALVPTATWDEVYGAYDEWSSGQ